MVFYVVHLVAKSLLFEHLICINTLLECFKIVIQFPYPVTSKVPSQRDTFPLLWSEEFVMCYLVRAITHFRRR